MRKFLLTLVAVATLFTSVRADEGMWLLPLLEKINSEALRNLGSKLSPEQIYSINNSSIKDAVVQFGGGCTAEIISSKGLLTTNFHCGYSNIQALSTEEHNYLEDGYWAKNLSEEIPVPGLTVKFLQEMTDITGQIKSEKDRQKVLKDAQKKHPNCLIEIANFYNDNVQYLIVSKIYRDVRFVGAPPAATGKFGGDTDNWMWPRHTCDFSMFRVYANADNEPADYSENNVPFTPRQFLNVSLKGVQEGDFAMVMGYPGSTQRYQTSAQLSEMLDLNEIRIAARTVRQDVMRSEMRADPKVSLQYANKYASSSNGWKKWQGMRDAFAKLDVIERQVEKENNLKTWIGQDSERAQKYDGAVEEIANALSTRKEANKAYTLLSETLARIEILSLSRSRSQDAYKDYDSAVDRKVALAVLQHYLDNVKPEDKIDVSVESINKIFDESVFTSFEKFDAARKAGVELSQDPAAVLADMITNKTREFAPIINGATSSIKEPSKKYAAALLEWTGGTQTYPDANMTCRLSYGSVMGYEPKDAVSYRYYTTLKGVMEKEEPGNYEFRVPARLKEIYQTKDYGQYANENGELVTCFLTNLDITGGNSGSPVMDAEGNLIGLAFDGNWEAMSGDVIFEPEYQRCIVVDIRYVLLILDKFGGAGYLLDEMNLVK